MKTYYIEFAISGNCGVYVKAENMEDAKNNVPWDDIELVEWDIDDLIGIQEEIDD